MKLKGRVSQIIEKKDYKKYFGEKIDSNFVLVLERTDYPHQFYKIPQRAYYALINKKDDYVWSIFLNKCSYKVGEIISLNVQPIKEEKRLVGVKVFEVQK